MNTIKKKRFLIFVLASLLICTLLLLPAIFDVIFDYRHQSSSYLQPILRVFISALLFLIPIVFFYRNIKIYLYVLTFWIILSPLFIFATFYYVRPNFELVALIFQTNPVEIKEATKGYLTSFFLITFFYLLIYLLMVRQLNITRISFKAAAYISLAAVLIVSIYSIKKKYVNYYKTLDIVEENYPLGTISGIRQAYVFLHKNKLSKLNTFKFNAFKKDSISTRQINIMIIGEASRYDRWEINGYSKMTSPNLKKRQNLVVFPNVVAGCNLTWMSVPQMITRADPENIDRQFREKSLLAAFKDVGFKTVWLSNQTDKDIFWSGSITLHAKTANINIFSPTNTPNLQTENYYDERLLPLLDSIIKIDNKNVFFVLHLMGSHWVYNARYPQRFDYFKPSGYAKPVNLLSLDKKEVISNAYDNSILYTDYIIDSVISTVKKYNLISTVTFLSDHGEDLFNLFPNKPDFHFRPSKYTLHVPFFIWTSDKYKELFTEKVDQLLKHREQKIGPENTFYTILDLADISFKGFDSTRSIVNNSFKESLQKYYDNSAKGARYYNKLIK